MRMAFLPSTHKKRGRCVGDASANDEKDCVGCFEGAGEVDR